MCNEGGSEMVFCDGPCHRHFHWNENDLAVPPGCPTLRLRRRELSLQTPWFCRDCSDSRGRCFICGQMGVFEDAAHGDLPPTQIVAQCGKPYCTRFYHRACVRHELISMDVLSVEASLLASFTCPRHYCTLCQG